MCHCLRTKKGPGGSAENVLAICLIGWFTAHLSSNYTSRSAHLEILLPSRVNMRKLVRVEKIKVKKINKREFPSGYKKMAKNLRVELRHDFALM